MEQAASAFVFLAGTSYLIVGIYLLRKSSTTRGRPEFYLGLAFLMDGLSYGFSELPYAIGADALAPAFGFIGRVFGDGCAIAIALFTWRVFRPDAPWARRLVWMCGALMVGGLVVSGLENDWDGMSPLRYKGFWLDWLGGVAPFLWLSVESSWRYLVTRRRIPLGLIDPLVCNRYLLIAVYATLGSLTFFILVPMYIVYEIRGTWDPRFDLATGIAEMVCLAALWVSFSAPAFYRRWVGGSDAAPPTER